MMIEKITNDEMDFMVEYVAQNGSTPEDGYDIDYSREKLENNLLSYWEQGKGKFLYDLFGHELILRKPFSIEKSVDYIEREMCRRWNYCFTPFYEKLDRALKDYCHIPDGPWYMTNYSVSKYNETLAYMVMKKVLTSHSLASNVYEEGEFVIGDIKVVKGMKIMKILNKLAKMFELEDEFEEFRQAHSRYLNDAKLSGTMCLSIHPIDFMTMSDSDCGWSSCMSWPDRGCYRGGTVEMMTSPCVVVAYVESDSKHGLTYDGVKWPGKQWRSLFVVTTALATEPGLITNVKGYPYQNQDLNKFCINWLMELANSKTSNPYKIYDNRHVWDESKFCIDGEHDFNLRFTTETMYNDFGSCDHLFAFSMPTEGFTDYQFCTPEFEVFYSGPRPCLQCGRLSNCFYDESAVICEDCDGGSNDRYEYCECCGDRLYADEVYWVDYEPVCQYCFEEKCFEDTVFGDYHWNDDETKVFIISHKIKDKIDFETFNEDCDILPYFTIADHQKSKLNRYLGTDSFVFTADECPHILHSECDVNYIYYEDLSERGKQIVDIDDESFFDTLTDEDFAEISDIAAKKLQDVSDAAQAIA